MPRTSSSVRRTVHLFCATLLAVLSGIALATPASAEEGYRYWNYFHLKNGEWTFATTGPSGYTPKDGAVEGYRFGATPASDTDGLPPRADLTEVNFETVCAGTEAGSGEKRVAVVIDYGTEADAEDSAPPEPRADCAVVPADANGMQVLQSVVDVRVENDFACALDGYPASGCGAPVKNVEPAGEEAPVEFALPAAAEQPAEQPDEAATDDAAAVVETEDESGFPWAVLVIGLIAAAVALGAVVIGKRSRAS